MVLHIVCSTLTYGGLCHAAAGHTKCYVLRDAGRVQFTRVLPAEEGKKTVGESRQIVEGARVSVQAVGDTGDGALAVGDAGEGAIAVEDARESASIAKATGGGPSDRRCERWRAGSRGAGSVIARKR